MLSMKAKIASDFKQGNMKSAGSRVRSLFEELGPTFVKMGQMLSIRSDLLPAEITIELEKLQDKVPPVPAGDIKDKILQELGFPVEELFHSFNEECVAAASIGQVHEAVLKDGSSVMVKVQRPGIKKNIFTDLQIMRDLSRLLEQRYDWARHYHLADMVDELAESIKKELDYLEEARNTETIGMQFDNHEKIKVPNIHWDYTTAYVLTMEKLTGIKLTELDRAGCSKECKRNIAELLAEAFLTQILKEGFFHGDPHPGNILYLPEKEQLGLIDFGQVGRLPARMRDDAANLMLGLMMEDTDLVVKALYRLAKVPHTVDENHFYDDIDRIRKKLSHMPLGELNLGYTIKEIFATAREHQIIIHKELTMMGKTLITFEGIIKDMDPAINIIELARPYGEALLLERYNPVNMGKRLWKDAEGLSSTLASMPGKVEELVGKTTDGHLKFEISLTEIKSILTKFDRMSNQISFSLTLLAFSIVVLGLIIGVTFGSQSILTGIPAMEIGFIIAFFMFLWILYSILKSGRF
ncbi:AarF/ABC1/UbiB kinase family protein [Mesobacillus zeae]